MRRTNERSRLMVLVLTELHPHLAALALHFDRLPTPRNKRRQRPIVYLVQIALAKEWIEELQTVDVIGAESLLIASSSRYLVAASRHFRLARTP